MSLNNNIMLSQESWLGQVGRQNNNPTSQRYEQSHSIDPGIPWTVQPFILKELYHDNSKGRVLLFLKTFEINRMQTISNIMYAQVII